MNIAKMNEEVVKLETVEPTQFVKAYCSFWATALVAFKNHLPKKHLDYHENHILPKMSIESVEAFKRCITCGKVEIYP